MGEVYRGRDTRLERSVAIKILSAAIDSAAAREQFDREARAISSLTGLHFCTLYDVGTQDDRAFLVMEYPEGETLSHRLRQWTANNLNRLSHLSRRHSAHTASRYRRMSGSSTMRVSVRNHHGGRRPDPDRCDFEVWGSSLSGCPVVRQKSRKLRGFGPDRCPSLSLRRRRDSYNSKSLSRRNSLNMAFGWSQSPLTFKLPPFALTRLSSDSNAAVPVLSMSRRKEQSKVTC